MRHVSIEDFDSDIEKLLTHFKLRLTKSEQEEIENVTLEDLDRAIGKIQEKQRATRSYRNLRRIEPFVTGMKEYGKVVEVFTNASPFVAFVWVCQPPHLIHVSSSRESNIFSVGPNKVSSSGEITKVHRYRA